MLVFGRGQFAAHFRWFLLTVALAAAAGIWYGVESAAAGSPVRGSSRVGLALGIAGALIIAFEMLLWLRKRFPALRTWPLVRTKLWMKAHIWLGLLCVPFAVLHTGFRLGGLLPASLLIVFLIVIASGVWGLYLQHVIPRRLLELVPDEVPAAEIERVVSAHTAEFVRKLDMDRGSLGGDPLPGIEIVREAFEKTVRPYLQGRVRPVSLRVPDRATGWFAELTAATPVECHPRVRELEELCGLRRQFDVQARLHWWLHNWVWIHLPLSIALVGLLVAHIYTALRFI